MPRVRLRSRRRALGGTVTFYYGSRALATATLGGTGAGPTYRLATITASTYGLPPGTYGLTARYNVDGQDAPSVSDVFAVTLQ